VFAYFFQLSGFLMSIREGSPAGNFPPIVLPHRFAMGFQTKSEWGASPTI
jgi:hypothetical protein